MRISTKYRHSRSLFRFTSRTGGSPSASKEWFKNSLRHRDDGPAVEHPGSKKWYKNGLLHREDGPAEISTHGFYQWRINGKLHRDDGLAIKYPNGTKVWYQNGSLQ